MADFKSGSRGGGFSRERSGGGRFGGRDRRGGGSFGGRREGRGRNFGGERNGRRQLEMHDVICSKCGKNCQVPFKPTGDKPVFCSACFESNGNGRGERRGFGRERFSGSGAGGITSEQFKQLNDKLDRILKVLENLEVVDDEVEEQ